MGGNGYDSSRTAVAEAMTHPLDTMKATAQRVPGAPAVKGAFDGMLDSVGAVSPRARRVMAYTGAGLLGVAGIVEWPLAAAGAAAVWLTQPRPGATTKGLGPETEAEPAQADDPAAHPLPEPLGGASKAKIKAKGSKKHQAM
jgi:hypothetical protein